MAGERVLAQTRLKWLREAQDELAEAVTSGPLPMAKVGRARVDRSKPIGSQLVIRSERRIPSSLSNVLTVAARVLKSDGASMALVADCEAWAEVARLAEEAHIARRGYVRRATAPGATHAGGEG